MLVPIIIMLIIALIIIAVWVSAVQQHKEKQEAERRKELVKIINETSEKFKISIRNIRRKYIDLVKDFEKDKILSIDESKKNQEDIQKSTDNSISEIDTLAKHKENEILKV